MCENENQKDFVNIRRTANGFLVENGDRMTLGSPQKLFAFEGFHNLCEHLRFTLRADELQQRYHHVMQDGYAETQRDELGEKRREVERLTMQLADCQKRLNETTDTANNLRAQRNNYEANYQSAHKKALELQDQIEKMKYRRRKRSKK